MKTQIALYSAAIALSIFNGIFSPFGFMVFALQGIWYPSFLPAPFSLMIALSGVISGLVHVLASAIPAAILEKFFNLRPKTTACLWLAGLALPTFQTLGHLAWF